MTHVKPTSCQTLVCATPVNAKLLYMSSHNSPQVVYQPTAASFFVQANAPQSATVGDVQGAGSAAAAAPQSDTAAASGASLDKSGTSGAMKSIIAGPVTPDTSPAVQALDPLTEQAQLHSATAAVAAGLSSTTAPGPLQSAPAAQSQQPSSGLQLVQTQPTTAGGSGLADPAKLTVGLPQTPMISLSQGSTHQLAPGSALQKQRLAMTDQSPHMAAAHNNYGGSVVAAANSPRANMLNGQPGAAFVHSRTASHPMGMQTSGLGADLGNLPPGQSQVPNMLNPAQRYSHGSMALPGHPVNSDPSKLYGPQQAAYKTSQGFSGLQFASASPSASVAQPSSAANPSGLGFAQPTWPHASPSYNPRPATPGSSLPAGAQVTVPGTHSQPQNRNLQQGVPHPNMKLDPNLQARQMLARSNAMTNAHAIVPGVGNVPNSALSRSGTAWQVSCCKAVWLPFSLPAADWMLIYQGCHAVSTGAGQCCFPDRLGCFGRWVWQLGWQPLPT